MHLHLLDSPADSLDSPIHRAPAGLKLAASLALILALAIVPPGLLFYGAISLLLVWLAAASNLPGRFLLRRMLLLEPFVLLAASLVLFRPSGGPAAFGILAVRSTLCVVVSVLLANTTPFDQMLRVLRRLPGFPALMITTLALMYRYLHLLQEESARMRRARASRTFSSRRSLSWRALSQIIAQLFVRASLRSERVYAAMLARGWR